MQKKWNFLCSLVLLMSVWACGGASTETTDADTKDSVVTEVTTTEEPKEVTSPEPDATTLEGFWALFREAVAAKDIEKLKSMSNMDELGEDFYDDFFFQVFQARIGEEGAALKLAEGQEEGTYEFSYMEIPENPASDEEGEGSGASLYFNKGADGNFQLMSMMAYG